MDKEVSRVEHSTYHSVRERVYPSLALCFGSTTGFVGDMFQNIYCEENATSDKLSWNNKTLLKREFYQIGNTQNTLDIEKYISKVIITDFKNEINVTYSGAVPNLFAEGKGVVAEGFLKDRNFFSATKILAKHDENYMPPEVKEALGEK